MKFDDKLIRRTLTAAIDLSVWKMEGKKDKVRKFDETIDLIINLKDINLKDPKQRIDKELILPNNVITSDNPNICVVASDEILLKAKNLGLKTLDSAGLISLDQEEKKEKKKFAKKYEYFVVQDSEMRNVARYLARFLGPLGKMPKPFPAGYGIVSSVDELNTAIERYKKIIRIQIKKQPIVQVKVGKKSMDIDKIFQNIKTTVQFIVDQMPHRYNNFKNSFIKTTMGRPIKVDDQFLKSIGVN